jgi:hypothetical protein
MELFGLETQTGVPLPSFLTLETMWKHHVSAEQMDKPEDHSGFTAWVPYEDRGCAFFISMVSLPGLEPGATQASLKVSQ